MKLYLVILTVFLFFSMLFIAGSGAIPACTFRTEGSGGCVTGETCILEVLAQENNTHIGSCDSAYTTKICCTELSSVAIRSSCNADEGGIISMYQTSNSHAGRRDYYSNIVCAKNSTNPIVANMRSIPCLARETCAFTVFQQNNTHVGRCGYYSTSVCIQQNLNVTITMILNTTTPNWNDIVQLQGVATRADGSAIDTSADPEDVKVHLNGSLVCATDTNSTGGYTCNFTAPSAVGLYLLNITVDDPTTSRTSFNTTTFNVQQQIGQPLTAEREAKSIACYEEPRRIQNPDGTIEEAIVRICVWK